MIRHVILIDFKAGTSGAQIAEVGAAMESISHDEGVLALSWGRDLGLRVGNMGYAAVFDFRDEASYRVWDTNDRHNQIRRDFAPIMARAERCQFEVASA